MAATEANTNNPASKSCDTSRLICLSQAIFSPFGTGDTNKITTRKSDGPSVHMFARIGRIRQQHIILWQLFGLSSLTSKTTVFWGCLGSKIPPALHRNQLVGCRHCRNLVVKETGRFLDCEIRGPLKTNS